MGARSRGALFVAWTGALVVALASPWSLAAFIQTGSIPLTSPGNHHGIAFDGTNWHIANTFTNTFHNYTALFTYINDTAVAGIADLRGMTYDANNNHLFIGDDSNGQIDEVQLDGSIVGGFTTFGGLNALAYDRRDNTLWIAYFGGGPIEHRTTTGGLLSSFTTPFQWTGLALDPVNNTLLAMDDSDAVEEYTFGGTLLGQRIPAGQLPNNGQGLAYDATIGRLYATSQGPGFVTIFDDPTRVPEPGALAMLLPLALLARRKRSDKVRRACDGSPERRCCCCC